MSISFSVCESVCTLWASLYFIARANIRKEQLDINLTDLADCRNFNISLGKRNISVRRNKSHGLSLEKAILYV